MTIKNPIIISIILLNFVIWQIVFSHEQDNQTEQTKPCSSVEFSQFDFWLGDWDLTWGENGKGKNTITRVLGSCVIQENFDGTPSMVLKGMSVSTFNINADKWHQTWVDNQGGYLDFTGEFKDEKMILSREYEKDSKKIKQRMVWYNIEENSLKWNWERSEDNGKNWKVLWEINYKRRK